MGYAVLIQSVIPACLGRWPKTVAKEDDGGTLSIYVRP